MYISTKKHSHYSFDKVRREHVDLNETKKCKKLHNFIYRTD
jgi:hypothetical protein